MEQSAEYLNLILKTIGYTFGNINLN